LNNLRSVEKIPCFGSI